MNELLKEQGNFLFRWRSYLPVIMMIPLTIAVMNMAWPLGSHAYHEVAEAVCMLISLSGLAVRIITIGHTPRGTSGRNTTKQSAWQLNTTGIYSVVRHPLYLGNFLIGLGPMMLPLIWWLPILYILAFTVYYERIMIAEEAFLTEQFGAIPGLGVANPRIPASILGLATSCVALFASKRVETRIHGIGADLYRFRYCRNRRASRD